jgi:LysM repeat protein
MTPRRWAIFIAVNIVVSALTIVLVLNLWDANRSVPRAVLPTAVPTLNAPAQTQVAATVSAPTKTPTPANLTKYTVQFGDTLSEIARKFDVSVGHCGDQQVEQRRHPIGRAAASHPR